MAAVTLTIDVPIFNFDIIQGQDLEIPINYTVTGIDNTMIGASIKMELRSYDYSSIIDSLTLANDRITIDELNPNVFVIKFPSAKTNTYKISSNTMKMYHKLELTVGGKTKRLFEGIATLKRNQK